MPATAPALATPVAHPPELKVGVGVAVDVAVTADVAGGSVAVGVGAGACPVPPPPPLPLALAVGVAVGVLYPGPAALVSSGPGAVPDAVAAKGTASDSRCAGVGGSRNCEALTLRRG